MRWGRSQASSVSESMSLHRRILSRYYGSTIYFPVSPISKSFVPRNSVHSSVSPKGYGESGNPDQETFPSLNCRSS